MKTWTLALGAGCFLAFGCVTPSQHLGDPQYDSYNHSAITGVVTPPEGALAPGAKACEGLEVAATTTDGQIKVGRVSLHESRNRCTYEVNQLPSDVDLTLRVRVSPKWTCESGSAATLGTEPRAFKLQSYETRTLDLSAQCARPQAS